MDEPENHLHPSMQRSLLADLIEAFPNAQFIVATHSPFMVSSVRDSNVYVLKYVDESVDLSDEEYDHERSKVKGRKVLSQKLDTINRAGSANEILREVLGVSATVPEWVEDDLKKIVAEFRSLPISTETLNQMRTKLDKLGFGQMYPRAVSDLVSGQ
jgi:predicted ATP-binding protein involved in virulence